MANDLPPIGARCRHVRERVLRWSLDDAVGALSEVAGRRVSRITLSRWEREPYGPPVRYVQLLSRESGRPLDWFLGEDVSGARAALEAVRRYVDDQLAALDAPITSFERLDPDLDDD